MLWVKSTSAKCQQWTFRLGIAEPTHLTLCVLTLDTFGGGDEQPAEQVGRRDGPDQLGQNEARRIARCNAGEGIAQRAGDVTAGFANEVDEVNQ